MARFDFRDFGVVQRRGAWWKLVFAGLAITSLTGASETCTLTIEVENLRSHDGMLRMCLTMHQQFFPECENDPAALHVSVAAGEAKARFDELPAGSYALSILHDENANSRLDTFAGIPREGIGFSRNPRFSFGPPKFRHALFAAQAGVMTETVRIKYFL